MIEETVVATLEEYSSFVARKAAESKPLWFRGVRDAHEHGLIPSLYRHPKAGTAEELRALEANLMGHFRDRAPPFYDRIPIAPMELLFFMQHHGAPTRLLDLSENPFTALFFALEIALWEHPDAATDSAVWIVDPVELNKTAFTNNDGAEKILSAQDDLLNAYLPDSPLKNFGKYPVGMFGVHNSRRIVAQRGVFILFGSNIVQMEKDATLSAKSGLMHKVLIKKACKREIASSLFNMGISDSVIYPDLDGLGRELKTRFGFWRQS